MLEELIRYLLSAELSTLDEVASRLSVSRDLLEQMLNDLARGGYLDAVALQCDAHCAGCPGAGSCAIVQGRRLWRLTEKGRRLAQRS